MFEVSAARWRGGEVVVESSLRRWRKAAGRHVEPLPCMRTSRRGAKVLRELCASRLDRPMCTRQSLRPNLGTVAVAQLVRASDCGSEGRGFKSRQPPHFARTIARGLATRVASLCERVLPLRGRALSLRERDLPLRESDSPLRERA